MKRVLYFVSGHGFGHSVRSALVVGELYKLGIRAEIISASPQFIFDCNLRGVDYGYREDISDTGVAQSSGIEVDLPATIKKWQKYLGEQEVWIEKWLHLCRELKPDAIVGDIVPLAFPLARRASIPSILVATFRWDWILNFYKDDYPAFGGIAEKIAPCYAMADMMIHTPLSYGLPEMNNEHFVPLIGKKSPLSKEAIRKKLGLDEREAFLVSFGGIGLNQIERLGLENFADYQFLFLTDKAGKKGNITKFTNDDTNHEELVAVSRAVITKPGYGIAAESILARTPMIYTSRGKFAEYEPLVADIKKYLPTVYISPEELLSGGLKPYLDNPPSFDGDYLQDPGTGAQLAARHISDSINR